MNDSCIITGGLGGIGSAIAKSLAVAAPAVQQHLCGLDEKAVVAGLATYHRVDVADADQVERWLSGVSSLRYAVINAAIVSVGNLRTMRLADWRREIDVNLNGAAYCAIAAARAMAARGGGRIVMLGSWAAERPHPHIPAYSTAKAGLRMLTKLLALEYAADHVVVNELAPGWVDAGLSAAVWEQRPELKAIAETQVPSGRLITAEQVADEVVHLLLRASPHITGSTVTMTGALDLRSFTK